MNRNCARIMAWALGAAVASAGTLVASGALAQEPSASDRATARELAQEGQEALWASAYAVAADRFSRAYALVRAPTLLLGTARADAGLGRLVEAHEAYNRILREGVAPNAPAPFRKALEDARKEGDAIAARLSWLVITVEGPTLATVSVDRAALPAAAIGVKRAMNPGAHEVQASAEGFSTGRESVRLAEGETTTLALKLERSPVAPTAKQAVATRPQVAVVEREDSSSTAMRTVSYVVLGLGGGALIGGAVTGILAVKDHRALQENCPGNVCPEELRPTYDRYTKLGLASTIGLAAGATCLVAGIYLYLGGAPSAPPRAAQLEPFVGLGSAGIRGRFQ